MRPDIEAESMGWTPLKPDVYLHVSEATAQACLQRVLRQGEPLV